MTKFNLNFRFFNGRFFALYVAKKHQENESEIFSKISLRKEKYRSEIRSEKGK